MIGLDTNILVRLIVGDDPKQLKSALSLITKTERSKEKMFINHVVLAEFAWVLSRTFKYPREEIIDTLESLMSNESVTFQDRSLVRLALRSFRSSSADFSDCLLNTINGSQGCETTYTFDKQAAKLPGMKLA
ncbi:MAG: type II toxin-antitoxin system VapC family toxin [Candidatus Omnitrophica bacterium]|nr:type II toxin-antitoxin system VapC family toxin [Candidatus Omnitrophota bacterium]